MSSPEDNGKLMVLRNRRNEAARHLRMTLRQQGETQAFIPEISQAIVTQLESMIETLDEKMGELESGLGEGCERTYVQSAFLFLYECEIADWEIPF